jgi:hypothetical protein
MDAHSRFQVHPAGARVSVPSVAVLRQEGDASLSAQHWRVSLAGRLTLEAGAGWCPKETLIKTSRS